MARAAKARSFDIDAVSAEVTERFDAVSWDRFNSHNIAERNETRSEVLRIRDELMKVSAVDGPRAAKIWDEQVPAFVPRPYELPNLEIIAEPVNAIEPGRKRRKPQAEPYLDPSPALGGAGTKGQATSEPSGLAEPLNERSAGSDHGQAEERTDARIRLLLDGLNKQYLRADEKYHFRDKGGEVAFEAQDKKLLTQHDTPNVVSSMIDLAETKGWSSIKLTGTKEFRREAWLQAKMRDMEVSGYQPDKLDKARLEELRAERAAHAPANTIVKLDRDKGRRGDAAPRFQVLTDEIGAEPRIPLTPTQDQFVRAMEATMRHRGDKPATIARAREIADERLTTDRIYVGKLIESGTAPYQDKLGEKGSHFVTLESATGQRTKVWGVDLPRALGESDVQMGETVVLAYKGRQAVTVDVPIKDAKGDLVRTERQSVNRNTWDALPFERLREDARASVLRAVERQERPADLKVFDPTTKRSFPKVELTPHATRDREMRR